MHYCIFIAKAMKGSGDYELDDDDEDCEELPELEEAQNEQVIIWLDGSSSGRENHGDYVVINDLSQSAVNLFGVVRECRRSEIPLVAYGQCRFLLANALLYPRLSSTACKLRSTSFLLVSYSFRTQFEHNHTYLVSVGIAVVF
jgi:hypothetical protein